MALTFSEAADSLKKSKKQPTDLIQRKLPLVLTNFTSSFLDTTELAKFCQTANFFAIAFEEELANRKRINEVFLRNIFDANPGALEKYITEDYAADILKKTCFREGYESTKICTYREGQTHIQPREKPQFICFREWRHVSPLQSTAYSGDEPFLLKLLVPLIRKDNNRIESMKQLQEVQRRISDQTLILEAITTIVAIEAGIDRKTGKAVSQEEAKLRFKTMQQSEEFRRLITSSIQIGVPPSSMKPKDTLQKSHLQSAESKIKAECKESKEAFENTKIKNADETEFLESLFNLLKAYINYYIQYPRLAANNRWDEVDKLWEIVGEWHKRLSEANRQVMCDDKPFSISPPPKFDSEPKRGPCRDWNGALLDLDSFGLGTSYGLYKGRGRVARERGQRWSPWAAVPDLASFAHLFELRRDRLGYIIEQLKTAETAHALIFPDKKPSTKCS